MLQSLQAGRAIAAVMVVLYHLNGSIFGKPAYDSQQMLPLLEAGAYGVDFFFVLSGFIIYHIHKTDIGQPGRLGDYGFKRFVRIYPTYWLVLALVLPVYFLKPSFGEGFETDPAQIAASVTLWPMPNFPILQVAWTLRHEVLFYFVFALLITNRAAGVVVMALWALACAGWWLLDRTTFPSSFLLNDLNLLFFLGIGAAWLFSKVQLRSPISAVLLIAGAAIFVITALQLTTVRGLDIHHICFGMGSALAIIGAVNLERNRAIAIPQLMSLLGDASYSIYLVHFPALSLAAKVLYGAGIDDHLPRMVIFLILFVGALAAGVAFHFAAEKPILMFFRRLRSGPVTRAPGIAPAG